MEPKAIQLDCTFTRHALRADKSVSLTFASALEANAELMGALFPLHQQEVTLLIAQDHEAAVADFKAPKNTKNQTKSQELRVAIYQQWKARHSRSKNLGTFEEFYTQVMNQLIAQCI